MKQAESVCKQLGGICRRLELDVVSKAHAADSITVNLRKSLIEGFFMQCAYIEAGGKHYLTVRDHQMAYIHPSSFLTHKPEWVLYHETMVTDRLYMRSVTAITPEMLIEGAPRFYHPEKGKLSEQALKSLERALPRANKQNKTK